MTALACQLCRPFRVPKREHSLDECQDAVAIDVPHGRFAIADGASESAQSGLWARLLVDAFVRGDGPPWPEWIEPLKRVWADTVKVPEAETLPWFLESRYREGAFATFLGVWLDGQHWKAVAVGDSCLFHVREGRLMASYPLEHSSQFDSTPWLIGSRSSTDEVPRLQAHHFAGSWRLGDRLFLMTDALSRWFLSSAEDGDEPWMAIEGLLHQTEQTFAEWINLLRVARVLKNDDTTLVAVCL
jgi:hypothetical protein